MRKSSLWLPSSGPQPSTHCRHLPLWTRQRQWSSGVSKGEKGPQKWLFHCFLVLRPLGNHDAAHPLCSGTRINPPLDNLEVRASEKHLGLYHHLPLYHISKSQIVKAKRFYANSSILCFSSKVFYFLSIRDVEKCTKQ